jgi:hypothetical protein
MKLSKLMLVLASLAVTAQAVEFDERLKVPLMKDAGALRTQAQSFSARFADLKDAGAEQLITNSTLANERFDLAWQIQQAIDVHRPLGDLTTLGFVARGDGSYGIDLNAFPQWNRLDQQMAALLPQMNWDLFTRQLVDRGMPPADVAKLELYVSTHDAHASAGAQALPVSLSFARIVRKYDKLKQPVPDPVVLSYVYQRARTTADATREWADGLLKSVGAQSARILLSILSEGQSTSVWAPDDQPAGIADILATVRQPDFEARATAQAKGDAVEGDTP